MTIAGLLLPRGLIAQTIHRPRVMTHRGFTLLELLVAISVMALLAVLSWRGLDGMARSQAQTSQRADEVLNLQAGLGQWKVDLDSLAQTQTPNSQIISLLWNGRVLLLTRRATNASDGLVVVAWMRRGEADGQWLRWQSPPVRTVGAWNDAWNRANVWSQTASAEDRVREVMITPLVNWQLVCFRGNAWTNCLSSAGAANPNIPGSTQSANATVVPDGIRLILELPTGQPVNGRITMDWVRPGFN
jgi:general secretion pathway protein J